MSTDNFDNSQVNEEESPIRIQDFISLCVAHWKWFVISVIITMGLATLYLLTASPTYTRSASILIKEDDNKSSINSQLSSLSDLGVFSAGANVTNEMLSLQSPATILEVVRRLNLDMSYVSRHNLRKMHLYGRNLPVTAKIIDFPDNEGCSFSIDINRDDKKVTLEKFRNKDGKLDGEVTGALGDTLTTPLGQIVVTPTQYFDTPTTEKIDKINVSHMGTQAAIDAYIAKLTVELADKDASVINLTCKDVNVQRAEEFLNTLMATYNEDWVRDKNQVATATSQFINDRLGVIEHELGNVDSDISSYKSEHLIPDVAEVSKMYLDQSQQAASQVLALNNQLYMARYIRTFLADSRNNGQLLPANSGLDNTTVERQITDYNERMLERNSLVANSSTSNPIVVDLDNALDASRKAIISSIDNEINALNAQIRAFRGSEAQSRSQIASNPNQAKYLLSVERQQKVKEALYLFLLQKREENELTQAFTAYNTRIITPPMGQTLPTAPVSRNILLIAFVAGLFIPAGILFLQESLNTKIRTRADISRVSAPCLGELPMAGRIKNKSLKAHVLAIFGIKAKAGNVERAEILVRDGSRNVINEAFRVVRSNLEFVIGKNNSHKVIMLTSLLPGSGKTFITANLAASFAIKGKKVCMLDLDLRKGTLSKYAGSPALGISDLLNGEVNDWHKIACHIDNIKDLTILPCGTIPPNPAELLYSDRLEELIKNLRENFDLVFIDCPPTDIVADTTIITPLADMTIFVMRAGLIDRRLVPNIQEFYQNKKFNNMTVLLNGVASHVSGYGYGYEYNSK